MKKGIIMEINDNFLTLLTPDGEFLRANNHQKHYEIGQEIDFFPLVQEERKSHLTFLRSFRGKSILAAALLFVLIFTTIFPSFSNDKVYAYMSIDVNPSIELGVNEKFQVIEMNSYNNEGKQLIASIPDWKKKNINELTSEIIRKMKEEGYIKNNHALLLTTVADDEATLETNERWKKEISEIKAIVNKEQLELKVIEGTKEEREKAKEKGLTTGEYKENQQVKVNKPTSNIIEKQLPKETSEIENHIEKPIPPGQAKKAESVNQIKHGYEEKETKHENKEKQIPPGQVKKNENNEKNSSQWERQPNKEEKHNNKNESFEKKQKNNDKPQNNHQQQKNQNNNKNFDKQSKDNQNNDDD